MVGEMRIPNKVEKEGNEAENLCALIFEEKLTLKRLGEEKSDLVEGSACDWINKGSITFVSLQITHCQSHVPKSDEKFHYERSLLVLCQKPRILCLKEFKFI